MNRSASATPESTFSFVNASTHFLLREVEAEAAPLRVVAHGCVRLADVLDERDRELRVVVPDAPVLCRPHAEPAAAAVEGGAARESRRVADAGELPIAITHANARMLRAPRVAAIC